MCRCCILHCNGKCHKQKTRVVNNDGKSIYPGHCNTAEICIKGLSKEKLEIELKKFEKREKSNDGDIDEVDGTLIYVWAAVVCDECDRTMKGTCFYSIHKQRYNIARYFDYCIPCYNNIIIKNDPTPINCILWTSLKCPYGGPDAILDSEYMTDSDSE